MKFFTDQECEVILDKLTDCYRNDYAWTKNAVNLMLVNNVPEVKDLTYDEKRSLTLKLTDMAWARWRSPNFRAKVLAIRRKRNEMWHTEMKNHDGST